MSELRRLLWVSVVALVAFPFAAWAWISAPVAEGRPVWTWLAVAACVAPLTFAWVRTRRLLDYVDVAEADRRVWRGWLNTAGIFAVPFVLRALERTRR